MKFGKEYAAQMIHEWADAYMDYFSLKAKLKQILRLNRQKDEFHAPVEATNPSQVGLKRRISLYRAFSGLTTRHRGSPRKSNHGDGLSDTINLNEEDEEAILVTQEGSESEQTCYMTTLLSSVEEGGEHEMAFFRKLDGEFNKVLRFYKQKVEEVMEEADELSRQLNVLIAMRIKVENPTMNLADVNAASPSPSSGSILNPASERRPGKMFNEYKPFSKISSPMAVLQDMKVREATTGDGNQISGKIGFKPAPLEVLDRVKLKIEPETPRLALQCMLMHLKSDRTFSKKKLNKAEELMSCAFVEFYQKLRLLKSYCFLNQLAFSKILKKYDKITSRNASKAYMKTVDNSYLGTCDEVAKLMAKVEATYIKHFANGNHREGMKSLRPKEKRDKHRLTFLLGFLSGCALALAVAIGILVHVRDVLDSEGRHRYMENIFPLYSLFGFAALHVLVYAANIYFWRCCRINYSFIFGFEPGTELSYREVLLVGIGLVVLTFAGAISNLDMEMDPRTQSFRLITELVPLALLISLLVIVFCPLDIIYHSSRYFLVASVWRCIWSPLYKVTLPDFFLADQFTSQVQAFRSLLFYVCYYGWGDFKRRTNECYESSIYRMFYLIIAIVPYWYRFAQCIRRLLEEKDRMHEFNSLKYLSAIIAVAARTTFEMKKGRFWLITATVTSAVATVVNTFWDLVIDWGLLRRNSKNPWLRDKLLVQRKSIYFIAMVLNTLLRLAWMQTVLGIREAPFLHQRALVALVASLEIIRRGIWNFFRLENEHLNNVGKYRAFKSVPLPFHSYDIGNKNV